MEKVLITGTGRCGTTFLIKLFTFLGFDTGYNRENYHLYIGKKCNSGMEKTTFENYIVKNPLFITGIEDLIKKQSIKIKKVIIPLRNLEQSAKSRVKYGKGWGGLGRIMECQR